MILEYVPVYETIVIIQWKTEDKKQKESQAWRIQS